MISYLNAIIFALAFVMYAKYQFQNEKGGQWHLYGLIMRGSFFAEFFLHPAWQDAICQIALVVWIYEVGINVIALKQKNPLYVGATSTLDIYLGKYKWLYMALLLGIAIAIRVFIK